MADFDCVIIGAGPSGLAAGIRLAHFDHRVCMIERQARVGGLNTTFWRCGAWVEAGLHALTNYAEPSDRRAPLNRLLRQLRIGRDELGILPHCGSFVRSGERWLDFGNGLATLREGFGKLFPDQLSGFDRLCTRIMETDCYQMVPHEFVSAREVLGSFLSNDRAANMLLCPVMFYGSPTEMDLDFRLFCMLFRSIFVEGLWRPKVNMHTFWEVFQSRFTDSGGLLQLNTDVVGIQREAGEWHIQLDGGDMISAEKVISTAGLPETQGLIQSRSNHDRTMDFPSGELSFVETFLKVKPNDCHALKRYAVGFFFEDATFFFEKPEKPCDFRSGAISFGAHFDRDESGASTVRVARLANYEAWCAMDAETYARTKEGVGQHEKAILCAFLNHEASVDVEDIYTPCTLSHFTHRLHGAIYGSPQKRRDGQIPGVSDLYICGTDQGFPGVIGGLLSGMTVANTRFLG